MTTEGHKVASLHGAKDAGERDAIIDSFREGREKVLITTNVIARGIDILQVNMVVNYDLPLMNERGDWKNKTDLQPDIETYIHRIGQSGCVRAAPVLSPFFQVAQGGSGARASRSTLCTTSGRGSRWRSSSRPRGGGSSGSRRTTWTRWRRCVPRRSNWCAGGLMGVSGLQQMKKALK